MKNFELEREKEECEEKILELEKKIKVHCTLCIQYWHCVTYTSHVCTCTRTYMMYIVYTAVHVHVCEDACTQSS